MTIEIDGLTERQAALATIIWDCEHKEQVVALVQNLPTQALKDDAQLVLDLMVLAVVDHGLEDEEPDLEQAQEFLSKFYGPN